MAVWIDSCGNTGGTYSVTSQCAGPFTHWIVQANSVATTTAVFAQWVYSTAANVTAQARITRPDEAVVTQAREVERAAIQLATRKARRLLIQHLTPEQRRTYEERAYFDVDIGGKTYRIRQGTHGNVRLIEGGVEKVSFCAQPAGVPTEDAMLAQKLMLETEERRFLEIANWTDIATGRYIDKKRALEPVPGLEPGISPIPTERSAVSA